jgi:predicted CopG family antitoxin
MKNPLQNKPITVLKIGSVRIAPPVIADPSPEPSLRAQRSNPSEVSTQPQDRKSQLIDQVEKELAEVRYQRAQVHLKYRDLLNHELKPKASSAEFILVYDEIESFSGRLKSLYLKKRQIELTGDYKAPRALDDLTKNKIDALKNEKKRISDNKYKAQKLMQKATVQGNEKNALKYEQKVAELDLKWMEAESRIELLLR